MLVDHIEAEENLGRARLLLTNPWLVPSVAQPNESPNIKASFTHNLKDSVSLGIKQGRERQKGSREHTEDIQIWVLLEGSEQRGT